MANLYSDMEKRFGISEYAGDHEGFIGVMKARYSDFLVHEIDDTNTTAQLVHVEYSGTSSKNESNDDNNHERSNENQLESKENNVLTQEQMLETLTKAVQELSSIINEGVDAAAEKVDISKLGDTLKHWYLNPPLKENPIDDDVDKNFTLPAFDDKAKRKSIHVLIKSDKMSPFAVADTVGKQVRVWARCFQTEMPNFGSFPDDRNSSRKRKRPNKPDWPKDRPNFLKFVLYKENMDTTTAVKEIARKLGISNKNKLAVGYAGMKDKRGVTAQFCTVYRKTPDDLNKLNGEATNVSNSGCGSSKAAAGKGIIRVGGYSYTNKHVGLGNLIGNKFDIVIRNISKHADADKELKETLKNSANNLKTKGFINYFGMQRFGKFLDTAEVGFAVLKGNFKNAVNIIMNPKEEGEFERIKDARYKWAKRFQDVTNPENEEELKTAEKECCKTILKAFSRFMNSENAIIHSLSRDPLNYEKAFFSIPKGTRLMFLHAVQSYFFNLAASARLAEYGNSPVVGDLIFEDKNIGKVRALTERDISEGNVSIFDIVLPQPGSKSVYPENKVAEVYENLMKENSISISFFKQINTELSLGGDFRYVMCKPTVDFKILHYDSSDPLAPLLDTDLMKITKDENIILENEENDAEEISDKKVDFGLHISFTLPPSAYATIALRELMKIPTSSDFQRQLQDKMLKDKKEQIE